MQTIHKFTLNTNNVQVLALPRFSECLSLQVQNGKPQLWALVDTEQTAAEFTVICFGTGHEVPRLPPSHKFLGTAQLASGSLVLHFFGFYSHFSSSR